MKYLKSYNESNTSDLSFTDKYSKEIESGLITIDNTRDYLKIKVKGDLDIPDLNDLEIKKEDDDTYWITKPLKFDFEDVISIESAKLEEMLSKSSEEIKSDLQSIYDKKYNNKWYLRKKKIRKLFGEYL
jgi:hypothetical protein